MHPDSDISFLLGKNECFFVHTARASFVKCGNMHQGSNFTGIPRSKTKQIVFQGEGPLVRKGSTQQPKKLGLKHFAAVKSKTYSKPAVQIHHCGVVGIDQDCV